MVKEIGQKINKDWGTSSLHLFYSFDIILYLREPYELKSFKNLAENVLLWNYSRDALSSTAILTSSVHSVQNLIKKTASRCK